MLVILIYAATCIALYFRLAHVTDGRNIYPLDDSYIQAAIGKNLAFNHSYGISPGVFATASSSIIWPFLLAAAFKLFGLQIWVPLAWNLFFAVVLLFAVDRILRSLVPQVSGAIRAAFLIAVVACTSLTTMTFVGMEHVMQALALLLFIFFAGKSLASPREDHSSSLSAISQEEIWLFAMAFFNTLSRFEGAFSVAVVFGLLILRGRFIRAIGVAISGAIPVAIFALLSISHGGHALPNSLLMKAARKGEVSHRIILFSTNGLLSIYSRHDGLAAVCLAAVLLLGVGVIARTSIPHSLKYSLGCYVACVLLHCQFARLGWLGRYEFYLIVTGVVLCGSALLLICLDPPQQHRAGFVWGAGAVAAVLILSLTQRFLHENRDIVRSAEGNYADTIQDARFLSTYYENASIVANDIGAISYMTDVQCLDLAGLGSNQITDLVLQHNLTRSTVDQVAHQHGARIALVFKSGFFSQTDEPDVIPTDWIEVGHLAYPDFPEIHTTYFMAVDPSEAQALRDNMARFIPQLPSKAHAVVNR